MGGFKLPGIFGGRPRIANRRRASAIILRTIDGGEQLKRADGLPPAMTRLVRELSRLPGIGEKTASRLAFNLLNRPREDVIALAESLLEMKERVGLCSECFGLSDRRAAASATIPRASTT